MVDTNLDWKIVGNIDGKINFNPWEIKTIGIQIK